MNAQTKICLSVGLIATTILLVSIYCAAQEDATQQANHQLIGRAQRTQVSQLDSSLPPISLMKWLGTEAGPDSKMEWEVNDCGEETGTAADQGRNLPVCVEADVHLKDGRLVVLMVEVATAKLSPVAKPVLYFGELVTPHATITLHRLSDLPAALVKTHQLVTHPEIAR